MSFSIKSHTIGLKKKKVSQLALLLLLTALGCNGGGIAEDYSRIIVRNNSDSEAVTIDVLNADGEVVLSELLEPKSSANARSAPGTHVATASVAAAEGAEGATYDETFDAGVVAYVTYNSAGEETEAGLSVAAPKRGGHDKDREDNDDGDDGDDDGEGQDDGDEGEE